MFCGKPGPTICRNSTESTSAEQSARNGPLRDGPVPALVGLEHTIQAGTLRASPRFGAPRQPLSTFDCRQAPSKRPCCGVLSF